MDNQENNQGEIEVNEVIIRDQHGYISRKFNSNFFSSVKIRRENGRILVINPGTFVDQIYSPGINESIEIS